MIKNLKKGKCNFEKTKARYHNQIYVDESEEIKIDLPLNSQHEFQGLISPGAGSMTNEKFFSSPPRTVDNLLTEEAEHEDEFKGKV
jgi:hypothetical protein